MSFEQRREQLPQEYSFPIQMIADFLGYIPPPNTIRGAICYILLFFCIRLLFKIVGLCIANFFGLDSGEGINQRILDRREKKSIEAQIMLDNLYKN